MLDTVKVRGDDATEDDIVKEQRQYHLIELKRIELSHKLISKIQPSVTR